MPSQSFQSDYPQVDSGTGVMEADIVPKVQGTGIDYNADGTITVTTITQVTLDSIIADPRLTVV